MFNYISVEFPLSTRPPLRVSTFNLMQNRYAHEMAIIRFKDWNVQYSDIRPNDPVKCILRGRNFSREFVGYIHEIKPEITPGNRSVAVSIIGASYKLKQARQRIFENVTADAVVKQVAAEQGFSAFTDAHPRVYEQIAQPGVSDLQLLSRLARQCGYSLRLENTSIYFQQLTTDFRTLRANAQRFEMRDANNPAGSTLYSFNLTLSESAQFVDAYKSAVQVGGVTPQTYKANLVTNQNRPETIRDTSSPELFDSFATNIVAPSYDIAYYEAVALDEKNRFPYRATIKVLGTPTIGPDKPIYLDGLGTDYSGYWIVLSARHEVVETGPNVYQYLTHLEVGADSLGQARVADNQFTFEPNPVKIRDLTVGVRDVPTNTDSVIAVNGGASPSNIGLGETNNRAQPASSSTSRAYVWKSKVTNIKSSQNNIRNLNSVVVRRKAR